MNNRIKKISVSILLLCINFSIHASEEFAEHRGVLDFILNAADYAYHVQYDEYVAGTDYLLGTLINETIPFSRLFSPLHATQLADMRYFLLSIKHEWLPCVTRYEYSYGTSLSTIMNVHAALNNTWNAMYYVRPSSWLLYDRELESILDYLENILYEIRRPVPYINSLGFVETCFNNITYIINSIR